ncbi:MAG: CoA-binding protein [Syntrophomonadaceae bacterium]|nr:CoA-binding protein [Syntrophomonadaceae bacterium]MDD3022615.1 CoA-binding protein [Syntrophomonadaceae bacterium]
MNDLKYNDEQIRGMLKGINNIAVVGLSKNPYAVSYGVAKYLQQNGYRIIPVNPNADEVLGEKCYPNLDSIPESVELVNVFRREDALPAVIQEALEQKVPAIWLQLGLECAEGAAAAEKQKVLLIQDRCLRREHQRLL